MFGLRVGRDTDEAHQQRCCLHIRSLLRAWYTQQRRSDPDAPLQKLADFDLTSIKGRRGEHRLDTKAAETGTCLKLCLHLCREFFGAVDQRIALIRAGDCLVSYLKITRSAQLRLKPSEVQGLVNAVNGYLSVREAAGIAFKPKCHLVLHLVWDSRVFGNPGLTATWIDESLNNQLSKVCQSAHAAVWSARVLAEYNHALGPAARQAISVGAKKRRRA